MGADRTIRAHPRLSASDPRAADFGNADCCGLDRTIRVTEIRGSTHVFLACAACIYLVQLVCLIRLRCFLTSHTKKGKDQPPSNLQEGGIVTEYTE